MDASDDLGTSILTVRYKIVFVGDVGVGKTSVMNRFVNNDFSEKYDPTIGVDFATKPLEYNENSLKLQLWDSAGQERYKSLIPSYVRGASIIFIIYDISSIFIYKIYFIEKETYANLKTWIEFIKGIETENVLLVLCGNKIDLQREVSTEEGKKLAEKEKMLFFEVSAKSGTNVNRMMYTSIAQLPFFYQFHIEDKAKLISELEEGNKGKEQNSIYDIVKGSGAYNSNNNNLNVNANKEAVDRIKKDKKGCKC